MKSLALIVRRSDGERVRRQIAEAGWLRQDLRILAEDEWVVLPIGTVPQPPIPGAELGEREFDPIPSPGPRSYRDLVVLPPSEAALLPRAFDTVGDIVLIRLPPELRPRGAEIGSALLEFVPGARLVGLDRGVKGIERRRSLLRLAGDGPWTTRHTENGFEIDVDLERAYFSPRLAREHARLATEIRAGDRVFDLCCGIGPFSLTIARDARAREIVAVDLNADAIALGRSNALRLGLEGRIRFLELPIEVFVEGAGSADRVIFNLPREGIKYLPKVGTTVGPGGSLYYYEVTEQEAVSHRPGELVTMLERNGGSWTSTGVREVHPYSPSQDLVAYSLQRGL